MLRIHLIVIAGLTALLHAHPALAQTPACDKLKGEEKKLALEILSSQHPYDCCDDTIANCLKKKPTCALAIRLAENICKRVAKKQDKQKIVRALSRRARTMLPGGKKVSINLAGMPLVGSPNAPITLVEYACARCPFCSKITPDLYEAIVNGSLKGKVKMYFRVFPIRNHEFSKETGLGFVAAIQLGKFWEFLLYSYEHFDHFCVLKQADWAEAAGMDRAAFEKFVKDPKIRARLVSSKKEGIVNKVDATPTFFINSRKYVGDLSGHELIDILEEEHERLR